jgi:mannose-1-phosphate guanylyltransferase
MVHTVQEKKVVIQGLDGFIIAENNDTLLICKLSEEQRIKQFSGQDK